MAQVSVNPSAQVAVSVTSPAKGAVSVGTGTKQSSISTSFDNSGTSLTSTNIEDALKEVDDKFFQQTSAPTGDAVDEGDLWYDETSEEMKVYK